VFHKECALLQKDLSYVSLYRYNPAYLHPDLNHYGNNGERKMWRPCGSTYCTCQKSCIFCTMRRTAVEPTAKTG